MYYIDSNDRVNAYEQEVARQERMYGIGAGRSEDWDEDKHPLVRGSGNDVDVRRQVERALNSAGYFVDRRGRLW